MKKKVIAVIMTAAIVMGMAACGGKDAGDSVPAAGVSAEDSTGVDSTDEIGASDEQNSDEADSSEDGGSEEADMEDSQTSEEESSEAVDERNLPDNYDWASVDWERVIWTYEDTSVSHASALIEWASMILEFEMTPKEYFDTYGYQVTYDELDEESKMLLEKLIELTSEERKSIYLIAVAMPDNYDWASVDWGRIIATNPEGQEVSAKFLLTIAHQPAVNRARKEGETTAEAVVNSGEFEYAGITAYDDLDEESRTILEKLDELWLNEIHTILVYMGL